jgi:hypothetical protein
LWAGDSPFWTGELPNDAKIRGTDAIYTLIRLACDESIEIGVEYKFSIADLADVLGLSEDQTDRALSKLDFHELVDWSVKGTLRVMPIEGVVYQKLPFVDSPPLNWSPWKETDCKCAVCRGTGKSRQCHVCEGTRWVGSLEVGA